ncbi:MAG: tRNA (guanosine(37)-N1)-methyltransferase TrmD [Clostridiales Family XIII bacterium]|jgi:tRNA (guanine37-N1)-methyltransferase|nr:tRNA (guanosine(37)-N1)-methyltransferase TrmD [Clostridiales Family XIII bacterium]
MKIDVLTVFPEMFDSVLDASMLARARDKGVIDVAVTDIRAFSDDKHRKTDGYPFGGGAGMVMSMQPIAAALTHIGTEGKRLIYLSPRGRILNEELITDLSRTPELVLLCGHYEGVDERAIDRFGFEEISIGDYILTGGELPAMVLIDAVARMLPGTLGNDSAHDEESVYSGLLEYPQYTRPAVWADASGAGLPVPDVLLSGNHKEIRLWNFRQALYLTAERRPDMFTAYMNSERVRTLDKDEKKIVKEVLAELRGI